MGGVCAGVGGMVVGLVWLWVDWMTDVGCGGRVCCECEGGIDWLIVVEWGCVGLGGCDEW